MVSKKHNFIVSAIVRKIRQEGFKVIYLDGKYEDINMNKPEITPKIIHHKPDIIGEKENGAFCIGEAKTENDISCERTKNQIVDFYSIIKLNAGNRLFLGVPLNVKNHLEKLLTKVGLKKNKQIEVVYIPKELFPHEEEI